MIRKFAKGCERCDDRAGFFLVDGEGVLNAFADVEAIAVRIAGEEKPTSVNSSVGSFVGTVQFCGVSLCALGINSDNVHGLGLGRFSGKRSASSPRSRRSRRCSTFQGETVLHRASRVVNASSPLFHRRTGWSLSVGTGRASFHRVNPYSSSPGLGGGFVIGGSDFWFRRRRAGSGRGVVSGKVIVHPSATGQPPLGLPNPRNASTMSITPPATPLLIVRECPIFKVERETALAAPSPFGV